MSIDQALTDLQDAAFDAKYFALKFVTMEGEVRHYPQCRYGAPDNFSGRKEKLKINERIGEAHRGSRKVALMRDDGTIPITNLATQEFRTPKWYSIIELNGQKVE